MLAHQPAADGTIDSAMALAVSARHRAFTDPLGAPHDN